MKKLFFIATTGIAIIALSLPVFSEAQPINEPPVVEAGPNRAISFGNRAALDGNVTDDGLPVGLPLVIRWSQQNGPGIVDFADRSAVDTTAGFNAPGLYSLKLQADDQDKLRADLVYVWVEITPGPNTPPTALAADETAFDADGSGDEPVDLRGQNSSDTDGVIVLYEWIEGGNILASGATADKPTITFPVGTHTVTLRVTDDDGATDTDTAIITVNAGPPQCPAPTIPANAGDRCQNITETSIDFGWTGVPGATTYNLEWCPQGTPFGAPACGSVSGVGPGTLQTVSGLTGATTYAFRVSVSGDDGVTCSADPTLWSTTGSCTTTATPNTPPSADAGSPQTVVDGSASDLDETINNQANVRLDGSGSSDSDGSIVAYRWSGPFGTTTGVNPIVTFPLGTHTVTLEVEDDDGATHTDTVDITVNAPSNTAPNVTANANPSTLTLPANTATLIGTAPDDGLPIPPGALTILWTKVSGPATTIANPSSLNTTVTLTGGAGTYTFQLEANDGALSDTATVAITVNAPAPPVTGGLVPCGGPGQPACTLCHVFELGHNIIEFILVIAVPIIATFLFAWGGFTWLTSAGNPARVRQGQQILLATVVGILIAYGAWLFVNLFLQSLGAATFEGTGGFNQWWKVECSVPTTIAPPSVSLTASPSAVSSGQQITLAWTVFGADSCAASGDWTSPPLNLEDGGTQSVTVTGSGTKTYTLNCTGPGGPATASALVEVIPAPIAHWKFDESAGNTAFDDAGGHNGTLQGGTWQPSSPGGALGGSLNFDGVDDRVQAHSLGTSETTMLAWINYRSQPGGSGNAQGIIDTMTGCSSAGYFYSIGRWDNFSENPHLVGHGLINNDLFTTTGTVRADGWHQVGFVWEDTGGGNSTQRLIVNGGFVASRNVTVQPPPPGVTTTYIGALLSQNCWPDDSYLEGAIADLKVWNTALTPNQVQAEYNSLKP